MDYKQEICSLIDLYNKSSGSEVKELYARLNKAEHLCLFGANIRGIDLALFLNSKNIKIDFFFDNKPDLWDKEICLNIPCKAPLQLDNYKGNLLIIITSSYYEEIIKQLKTLNFNNYIIFPKFLLLGIKDYLLKSDANSLKENMCNLADILSDKESIDSFITILKNWYSPISSYDTKVGIKKDGIQYFPENILNLTDNEVFVDVGTYDGDTIQDFLIKTNNKFNKIISYELDYNNYLRLQKNIQKLKPDIQGKIICNNLGLFNKNMTIKYHSNTSSTCINNSSGITGHVVALSEHLKDIIPTYIKMDIEGAEMEALIGAEKIIKKYKPKLAICVYHSPDHFWKIPFYLKTLVPDYKIYLRHYSDDLRETVCFAI
ncbi:MAG: FkbM family methyltransferase [bacterium]|nr:FkbM family methyltransferase [bacterium]